MNRNRRSFSARMGAALLALAGGFALVLSGCSNPASSSSGTSKGWTWVAGSSSVNEQGSYTSTGSTCTPGARYASSSWTDSDGNLWLFGGQGYSASSYGYLNDLWKYDISAGTWTWVAGSSSVNPMATYPSATGSTGTPGSRCMAMSWYDSDGNLWLFGGYGFASSSASAFFGYLNDLWKYDIDAKTWTWMAGSSSTGQTGTYPSATGSTGTPGGRSGASAWYDSDGNLWLFGGYGCGSSSSAGRLNDLWKYDISAGTWTWVAGSSSADQAGSYTATGSTGTPGARYASSSWTDSDGNLWLFGGQGYGASSSGYLNDLWKYDGTDWTWVAGSSSTGQAGTYTSTGSTGTPGGRNWATAGVDSDGNFWLFGGQGNGASSSGFLNDLWKYDGTDWTWVAGSSSADQAGTYTSTGSTGTPGGRAEASAWYDSDDNFWLFGGYGYGASSNGSLNDLWKYSD